MCYDAKFTFVQLPLSPIGNGGRVSSNGGHRCPSALFGVFSRWKARIGTGRRFTVITVCQRRPNSFHWRSSTFIGVFRPWKSDIGILRYVACRGFGAPGCGLGFWPLSPFAIGGPIPSIGVHRRSSAFFDRGSHSSASLPLAQRHEPQPKQNNAGEPEASATGVQSPHTPVADAPGSPGGSLHGPAKESNAFLSAAWCTQFHFGNSTITALD